MNTNQLEYFMAVADTSSFTKAAQKFNISQTAVTQQIKSLEDSLGVELFTRSRHQVELTTAGKYFYTEAKGIVHRLHEATEQARLLSSGMSGALRIGWMNSFEQTQLPQWIRHFHEANPHISMQFTRDNAVALYDMLQQKDLDLVFNLRFDSSHFKNIEFLPIQTYPVVAILPPEHPLAHKEKLNRDDLKGEQFVLVRQGYGGLGERQQEMRRFMTDYIDFSNIHYAKDTETIMFMVAAGFGVSFLPDYTLSAVKDYHLKALPIEGVNLKAEIIAAWISDNSNPSLKLLVEEIRSQESGARSQGMEQDKS